MTKEQKLQELTQAIEGYHEAIPDLDAAHEAESLWKHVLSRWLAEERQQLDMYWLAAVPIACGVFSYEDYNDMDAGRLKEIVGLIRKYVESAERSAELRGRLAEHEREHGNMRSLMPVHVWQRREELQSQLNTLGKEEG